MNPNKKSRNRGIPSNAYLFGLLQRLVILKVKSKNAYTKDSCITNEERDKHIKDIGISESVFDKFIPFVGKSNPEAFDQSTLDRLCNFLSFGYTSWNNFVEQEATDLSRKLPQRLTLSTLKQQQPKKFEIVCEAIHERVSDIIKEKYPNDKPNSLQLQEGNKSIHEKIIYPPILLDAHQTKKQINWLFENLGSQLDIFTLLPHTIYTFGGIIEGYGLVDLATKSIKAGIDDDINHLSLLTKMSQYFLINNQKDKRDIFAKHYYNNSQRIERVLYDFNKDERNIVHSYGMRRLSNNASIEISNSNFGKKHIWTLEQMSINWGTKIFKKGYDELDNSQEMLKEIELNITHITEQDEQKLLNTLFSIENKGFKFITKAVSSPLKSHIQYYKGFIHFLFYDISKQQIYLEQAIEALQMSKELFLNNENELIYRNMTYCTDLLLFMCYREFDLQKAELHRVSAFNFFKYHPKVFKFKYGVYSSRFAKILGLQF